MSAVHSFTSYPVVLTTPSKSFKGLNRVIFWEVSVTLKVVVPVPFISRAPLCVIAPVVAVAVRFPPTLEAARSRVVALTTVALPLPLVARATEPVTVRSSRVIALPPASVVALRSFNTVTLELLVSVMVPPLSKVRFPSMVDVPMIKFVVPPSISTSAK